MKCCGVALALVLAAEAMRSAAAEEQSASIGLAGTIEPAVQIGLSTPVQGFSSLIADSGSTASPKGDPVSYFLGTAVVVINEASNVRSGYTLVFESIPSPLADASAVLIGGTRTDDSNPATLFEFSFGGLRLPIGERRTVLTRPSDHANQSVRTRNAALRIKQRGESKTAAILPHVFRLIVTGP